MAQPVHGAGPMGPVVWVAVAACAGALAIAAPVPALAAAAAIGALLAARGPRWAFLLAAGVFAASALRASAAVDRYEHARAAMIEAGPWPARCEVAGTIARSPIRLGDGMRIELEPAEATCRDGPPVRGRIALVVPGDDVGLERGAVVAATAALAPPYRFWNDGDPRPPAARRGILLSGGVLDLVVRSRGRTIGALVDRVRGLARARIAATFPLTTAPMARALVLGEEDLELEDQRAFRRSGLAHLLAVSGMHLVLVVMGFVAVVRALLVRVGAIADRVEVGRIASAVGIPAAWIYADFAGGSGSAVRAAWMCTAVLASRVFLRRADRWRSLALSLVAMAVGDPLVVFDLSFVLSAFATIGLIGLAGPIEEAIARRTPRLPRWCVTHLVKPFAATSAATVACAPALAWMAPELPLGGLLANVIAVPLGEAAALPLCLVHGLLAAWPSAEHGCAVAASGALALVRGIARAFVWGALPLPSPTAAELATLAVVAALWPRRRALLAGAVLLAGLELGVRMRGAPRGQLRVTFLDVGQGDAALVDLPDGSALLVDGGGLVGSPIDVGERAIAPLLAARRRTSLAAAVLSHPHPDHLLGLGATFARAPPRAFWDTGQGEAEGTAGAYGALLEDLRRRAVPVLRPADLCGSRIVGGATIDVLAPCPAATPDRGANDNSFVLRIRYGQRAVLFAGDAERAEEAELVRRFGASGALRADVLKVGHHGSRTSSTPAFLAAVAPSIAVISCGVRNRFGHPHADTLAALRAAGARMLRTDRDGAVIVTTDGRSLDVRVLAERN